MITKDEYKRDAIDLLEKHYPKGNAGRGEAMVFMSELILRHEEIIKAIYVRRADTKSNEVGNVERPDVPKLSTGEGTIRSRMPTRSDDGATYRVGARLIPRRPQDK